MTERPAGESERRDVGFPGPGESDRDLVILEMALRKEAYARNLYEQMHEFVQREDSRLLLQRLIADETRHYELLLNARSSGDFSGVGGQVGRKSLGIPDYLIQEDIQRFSGPEEIVKFAIRREEEAEEFYLSRIGFLTNPRLRTLYRKLAEEEAGHRQDLLAAYDDLIIMGKS